MAHKTLIGGTAYEITGGKTLVDGTAYSIKNGKTLVDGTVYEVGFAEMATITITGDGGYCYAEVTIDGTTYRSATTIEVPVGTVISCHVYDEGESTPYSYISKNGEQVYSGLDGTYEYAVAGNTTISLATSEHGKYVYGYIKITEPDKMRTLTLIGDFSETDYYATDVVYLLPHAHGIYGGTHELPFGTTLYLDLCAFSSGVTITVFLNGQSVFVTTKQTYEKYYFTLNHNTTIKKVENSSKSCYVYITEET